MNEQWVLSEHSLHCTEQPLFYYVLLLSATTTSSSSFFFLSIVLFVICSKIVHRSISKDQYFCKFCYKEQQSLSPHLSFSIHPDSFGMFSSSVNDRENLGISGSIRWPPTRKDEDVAVFFPETPRRHAHPRVLPFLHGVLYFWLDQLSGLPWLWLCYTDLVHTISCTTHRWHRVHPYHSLGLITVLFFVELFPKLLQLLNFRVFTSSRTSSQGTQMHQECHHTRFPEEVCPRVFWSTQTAPVRVHTVDTVDILEPPFITILEIPYGSLLCESPTSTFCLFLLLDLVLRFCGVHLFFWQLLEKRWTWGTFFGDPELVKTVTLTLDWLECLHCFLMSDEPKIIWFLNLYGLLLFCSSVEAYGIWSLCWWTSVYDPQCISGNPCISGPRDIL